MSLPITLGRPSPTPGSTDSRPVETDLAALPHLLVAGTTGSGKSVFLNSLLLQLIDLGPTEVRLMLMDPKRVEFMPYRALTHVYVSGDDAAAGLRFLQDEMDARFELLDKHGVRDLAAYNDARPLDDHLFRWVCVIDELAALVLGPNGSEIVPPLTQIAQMARAAGIHLVLATQRPTTDVVTGLLKANIPARVSFAVITQIDSRVILDEPGAEELNGKGDMLVRLPGQRSLQRLQGDYVSTEQINAVVDRYKEVSA